MLTRRFLIYALGGGAGHLTRALSFARAASRSGHHSTIISNSPWAEPIRACRAWPDRVELRAIAASASKDDVIARVTDFVASESHDAFIVDTFPRGLAGELPALTGQWDCPRVWIHRDLTPEYCGRPDVAEAAAAYDLVLSPGERGPLAEPVGARRTAPWLSIDDDGLLPRAQARELLHADAKPLALVLGSPDPAENADAARTAATLAENDGLGWSVRFATLGDAPLPAELCAPKLWPLMTLFAAVDALVGAGGYNTVHEARAAGVPLLATARARLYDRQAKRLRAGEQVAAVEIEPALRRLRVRQATRRAFDNGAHEALRLVIDLLG